MRKSGTTQLQFVILVVHRIHKFHSRGGGLRLGCRMHECIAFFFSKISYRRMTWIFSLIYHKSLSSFFTIGRVSWVSWVSVCSGEGRLCMCGWGDCTPIGYNGCLFCTRIGYEDHQICTHIGIGYILMGHWPPSKFIRVPPSPPGIKRQVE